MSNPFADPCWWSQISIGGVVLRGVAAVTLEGPDPWRSAGRTVGAYASSVTLQISRDDYARLRSVVLRPLRRALLRRQLATRALARSRVCS